ncbi:MAG: type II secretion system F family protein [Fimbriimonadaceae bacterium]
MPFYQYVAVDSSGSRVEGTLQSPSLRDASSELRRQGLKVSKVVEGSLAPPQPPKPTSPQAPLPVIPQAPNTSTPQHRKTPSRKTGYGTEKDTFLLFSQLASYLKSGINPQQAFDDLTRRVTRKDYQSSLVELKAATSRGEPMSDTLEKYPKLYPPHIVGLVRAGEQGGFLPEAAIYASNQAEASMKFSRPFWIFKRLLVGAVLAVPLALAGVRAALEVWTVQEASGGGAPALPTLFAKIWEEIKWPIGPALVCLPLGLWLINMWWSSLSGRIWRHRLALVMPVFAKRASSEGSAMFAWALSNLSKAGITPQRAWQLAVEAVPNLAYKERLKKIGASMNERTRLSEALSQGRAIPRDYALIVQTGETTGDVPGALMNAASMSQTEFEATEPQAKKLARQWGCLTTVIGYVLMLYILYSIFYPGLIERVTE